MSSTNPTSANQISSLKHEWMWLMVSGIIMILGAMAAFSRPLMASVAVELLVGWAFIFSGIAQVVMGARFERRSSMAWAILIGIAGIILGVSLLANPLAGLITLNTILAILLIAGGVFRIVLATSFPVGGGKLWLIVAGIVSILLGGAMLANLIGSALVTLGILLGVDLLFSGVSLIASSICLKKLTNVVEEVKSAIDA